MIDIEKIQNKNIGKIYTPLYLNNYSTVKNELEKNRLKNSDHLIVIELGDQTLAFSKHLMAFHHIAQGYFNKSPYMLTFCVICNTGMFFNPVVENKMLHFYVAGVHNGALLMADKETNTYWDHITGKGLLGKYKSKQLDILQSHKIFTVKETLKLYPNCSYGKVKMNFFQRLLAKFQNWKANTNGNGFLPPGFRKSMPIVDARLPEMEMGLGIWVDNKAKFYPISLLKKSNNLIFDNISGKNILIYISPTTYIPSALFTDKKGKFDDNKIILDDGSYIISGNLYSENSEKLNMKTPNNIFSRWYGFSLTFPNCEIKV